jgi:FKBP-type peptidyl-prolyl cis-trans isomerase FkpA
VPKILFIAMLCGLLFAGPAGAEMITTDSGLRYEDLKVGTGPEAITNAPVEVQYTGWLSKDGHKGRKFDSTLGRNSTFSFQLGTGKVIEGWEEGILGMKAGGKRVLYVPASLGYGTRGARGGVIPPDADLIFEVELLRVNGIGEGIAGEKEWGKF